MANLTLGSDQAGSLSLFKQAYALAPDHADLLFDRAWAVMYAAGDTDSGATLFRRWFEFAGGTADRGSFALQALNYASNQNPETVARLHREWAAQHADPLGQSANFHGHDFRTDRPLRVGLLSSDFCRHPVGRFALTLCPHLDRSRFELFVYANRKEEDELKASFESLAAWRNIFGQTDDAAVGQVADDRVDIRPKGGVDYFLKLHNEIDLMLDPFPYNGGVTTGDAFWMGVPLLCLEGDAYVSRQGVLQNKCLGLEAFIAQDEGEFVEKAVQISNNPDMLVQLRENLRGMLGQNEFDTSVRKRLDYTPRRQAPHQVYPRGQHFVF